MYHLVSVGFRDVCSYDIAIRNHACWCNMAKSFSLFQYFFTAYPWRSTLTLLALTASALAEGVGIAMLFPLIGLVVDVEGTGGTLTTYVERVFAFIGLDLSLAGLLVMIVVAISLKSMLMLLAMTQVGYSAAHVAMDLRLAFIRALLEARWTHFVDWRPGEMASAISVEPARTATAYVSCCRVLVRGDPASGLSRPLYRHILGDSAGRARRQCVGYGCVESSRQNQPPGRTEPNQTSEVVDDPPATSA